jgi:glycosyl-4,4'-diaponeurosporenoate acyltransferase
MLIELPAWGLVVANFTFWMVVHLGWSWFMTGVPLEKLPRLRFLAVTRSWERSGGIYQKLLRVDAWKDRLPDGAALFRSGYQKKALHGRNPETLAAYAAEAWRGELTHWAILATGPLCALWNPGIAILANGMAVLALNLPCLIALRYNRARISDILARQRTRLCPKHELA